MNNSNGLHNHADAKLSGVFYFEDYEADVDAEWRGAKEPRPGDLLLRTASSAKLKERDCRRMVRVCRHSTSTRKTRLVRAQFVARSSTFAPRAIFISNEFRREECEF